MLAVAASRAAGATTALLHPRQRSAAAGRLGRHRPGPRTTRRAARAYVNERVLPAPVAVHLPNTISGDLAAGNLLRASTLDMLTRQVAQVRPGLNVLVHAAAGGIQRLLYRIAFDIGSTVIGAVG